MPTSPASVTRGTTTTVQSRAVLTFVTPSEQHRIDAAGQGVFTSVHRDSAEQLLSELRTRPYCAVVVSVSRYQQQHAPTVARLVREFPGVPAVALLTASEGRATQAVLALGHHGVRTLVDAREPTGWRDLRQLVTRADPDAIETRARARVHALLRGAHPHSLRMFDTLFGETTFTTVRQFARALQVHSTTLMSRFFRAGLPPAKRYVSYARLIRAARLLESPGLSITQVAFQLDFSSPQSFSRHLHGVLQMGALDFRRQHTGETMLDLFSETLVSPYSDALLRFDPLASPAAWAVPLRMVPDDRAGNTP